MANTEIAATIAIHPPTTAIETTPDRLRDKPNHSEAPHRIKPIDMDRFTVLMANNARLDQHAATAAHHGHCDGRRGCCQRRG